MSMEFFAYPWMELFFKEDTDKYKFSHLSSTVTFLPYGVAVDEFQHYVYENVDITPEQRRAKWREIEKKYLDYQTSTKNYILAKAKSLQINDEEKKETTNKIENLEHVKYLLNPSNTYVEKMGFDTLLYQINNYYRFNFKSLKALLPSILPNGL